jgi:hypothetical protein
MNEQAKSGSLKPFAIGLAVGLVVGGLGGAYLSGISEGPKLKSPAAKPAPVPNPSLPRDVRPGDTPPPAPTGEAPTNQALPEKPPQGK